MQTNELTKYLVIEVDDNYNDKKNPLIFLRGNYNTSEEAMSARNSLENLATLNSKKNLAYVISVLNM
jgi:hypothetical protein